MHEQRVRRMHPGDRLGCNTNQPPHGWWAWTRRTPRLRNCEHTQSSWVRTEICFPLLSSSAPSWLFRGQSVQRSFDMASCTKLTDRENRYRHWQELIWSDHPTGAPNNFELDNRFFCWNRCSFSSFAPNAPTPKSLSQSNLIVNSDVIGCDVESASGLQLSAAPYFVNKSESWKCRNIAIFWIHKTFVNASKHQKVKTQNGVHQLI